MHGSTNRKTWTFGNSLKFCLFRDVAVGPVMFKFILEYLGKDTPKCETGVLSYQLVLVMFQETRSSSFTHQLPLFHQGSLMVGLKPSLSLPIKLAPRQHQPFVDLQ